MDKDDNGIFSIKAFKHKSNSLNWIS